MAKQFTYCGLPGTMIPGPGGNKGLTGLGVFYNPGKVYSADNSDIGYIIGYGDISGNNIFDTKIEIPLINEYMYPRTSDAFIYKNGTDLYLFTLFIPENGLEVLTDENKEILKTKYPEEYSYLAASNYIVLLKYQGKHTDGTNASNTDELLLEISSYPLQYTQWTGEYENGKPVENPNTTSDYYLSVFNIFCGTDISYFNDMIIEAEFIPNEFDFNARTCRIDLWNATGKSTDTINEFPYGYLDNYSNKINYDNEYPGIFKMQIKSADDTLSTGETQFISAAVFPKNILDAYSVAVYALIKTNGENYKKVFLGNGNFANTI